MLVISGLVADFRRNGQKGGQSGKKIPPSLTLTQNSTVLKGETASCPPAFASSLFFRFTEFFHVFLVLLRVPAFCSVQLCITSGGLCCTRRSLCRTVWRLVQVPLGGQAEGSGHRQRHRP